MKILFDYIINNNKVYFNLNKVIFCIFTNVTLKFSLYSYNNWSLNNNWNSNGYENFNSSSFCNDSNIEVLFKILIAELAEVLRKLSRYSAYPESSCQLYDLINWFVLRLFEWVKIKLNRPSSSHGLNLIIFHLSVF